VTATTPTWAIPYATGTDRLCDGADITAQMALRVDAILQNFADDIAFLANIPCAGVELAANVNVPTVGGSTSPVGVPWDLVNYDTDNMVNLPVDPAIITYQRPGYFIYGGGVNFFEPPSTVGQKYTAIIFSTSPATAANGQEERDNGTTMLKSMGALNSFPGKVINLGEGEIDMELSRSPTSNGSPATVEIPSFMYARWYGEL
jgi:hypothetical protein